MDQHEPDSRPKELRAEDAFVTMVVPQGVAAEGTCCSYDTLSLGDVPELSMPECPRCIDTQDDLFASLHGSSTGRFSSAERETLLVLLEGLRDAARGPLGVHGGEPEEETLEPEVLVRVGPLVESKSGLRVSWLEVMCDDTGEGLLPDISWLLGELPPDVFEARDGCVWEQFNSGAVRLELEFAGDLKGDLFFRPLLPVECGEEALRQMVLSVRSGGVLGPSCLHATLLHAVGAVLEDSGTQLPDGCVFDAFGSGVEMCIDRVWCLTNEQTGYEFQVYVQHPSDGPQSLGRFEATFGVTQRMVFGLLALRSILD